MSGLYSVKGLGTFDRRWKKNDLKTTMYPNSRLLSIEMQEGKTASFEKDAGVMTCDQSPSLVLAPPRQWWSFYICLFYVHCPRYFIFYFTSFLFIKGLPQIVCISGLRKTWIYSCLEGWVGRDCR